MELASTFANPLLKDYVLDSTYDEMFTEDGLVRPHYARGAGDIPEPSARGNRAPQAVG